MNLGCRNVLSFDAKPIPGLGLHHRTHWGSLIGVGVAIGIGIGIERENALCHSVMSSSTSSVRPSSLSAGPSATASM